MTNVCDGVLIIFNVIDSQTGVLTFGPKDSEELKEKSENLVKQGKSYEFFTASEVGLLSILLLLYSLVLTDWHL